MLPSFDSDGDLPGLVHPATIEEIALRFGEQSPRWRLLTRRLREILELASNTGHLRQAFLWGSYITSKPEPNDVDILLVMSRDFDSSQVVGEARLIFDGEAAERLFGASVWWVTERTEAGVLDAIMAMIRTRRDQDERGIVEVTL